MLKRKSNKILITIVSGLSIVFIIVLLSIIFYFSNFLSKTTRVTANTLLVEGWLPPYAIEMAYKEFKDNGYSHIVTTGLNSGDYYMVHTNGYLIFYTKMKTSPDNGLSEHVIDVDAYSELGGENSARFNVYVNDSLAGGFTAGKMKRKYELKWKGKLTKIDSIMVQFVNDKIGSFGDRNLYIKEIIIDNKITIPFKNYSVYEILRGDRKERIVNDFSSYAQLARSRLLSLGIDSALVIAIPGERVRLDRTLTSALAFRDWLKTSENKIKGINIVTLGTHARRTWMTYNRILHENYEIGVISLPDYKARYSRRYKVLKTFRESVGLIYYWLILIPY